jgi:hypothetical protein
MGNLMALLGKKAPHVVSINTTRPEGLEAWLRDTMLKQKFLYT